MLNPSSILTKLKGPRVTTLYKQTGTKSYRLGSTKFFGYGDNRQNQPKELRKLVVPDPGCILFQVDQAGAEALIVAYLCNHRKFRSLFINGVKPHVYVALHVFHEKWRIKFPSLDIDTFLHAEIKDLKLLKGWKVLEDAIKSSDGWAAHERYYFIAKMICHGLNYGMKGPTFAMNVLQKSDGRVRLSVKEATNYYNIYHNLFPEIREWHVNLISLLSKDMFLRNMFGYPRKFTGAWNDELHREAISFIPQSTVGCITHHAFAKMFNLIEKDNLEMELLQNGHDSIMGQCLYSDDGSHVENILKVKDLLCADLTTEKGENFKMKAEVAVGWNWGSFDKKKNPLGLKEI